MEYKLEIKPAIPIEHRHRLQDALKLLGYHWHGGGTDTDMSVCNITFSDAEATPITEECVTNAESSRRWMLAVSHNGPRRSSKDPSRLED